MAHRFDLVHPRRPFGEHLFRSCPACIRDEQFAEIIANDLRYEATDGNEPHSLVMLVLDADLATGKDDVPED